MKQIKVKQHYNKNQFIIYEYDKNGVSKVYFQSYQSLVATYDKKTHKLVLSKNWNYSNTTRKHLYLFIYDYVYIEQLRNIEEQKNKAKYIQKLIDNKIIKYDPLME